MREFDRGKFAEAMTLLRNAYGAFFGDADEWNGRLVSYFEQLRKYELRDVEEALRRAPGREYYAERFPHAGQVERLAVAVELERKQRDQEERDARRRRSEDDIAREDFAAIPFGAEAQRVYIEEATGPFDRLARVWQCESKNLGLDPTKPSPPDIQARRMREFWSTWANHEPRTLATPHARRALPPPARALAYREPGEDDDRDQQTNAGVAGTNTGEAA